MTDITITVSVDDDSLADPGHETGLTNEAYENLSDLLSGAGYGILDVVRVADDE